METSVMIPSLLLAMGSELHTEIKINLDSTEFWKKAQVTVFENPIAAFRESITNLQKTLVDDADAMNYFTTMVLRITANPITKPALKEFIAGFDAVSKDAIFGNSITFEGNQMSITEQLLLFIAVHRNLIQIEMYKREEEIKMEQRIEYELRKEQRVKQR